MGRLKTGHQMIAADELHVSKLNDKTRTIAEADEQRLDHALRQAPEHLDARPLIVDVDGAIIGGRHRWETAQRILADKAASPFKRRFKTGELPCYVRRFKNDAERVEWMTRDNADYARWVMEEIAIVIADHQNAGADAALLGFAAPDLAELLELAGEPTFVPVPPDPGASLDTRVEREVTCPSCDHTFKVPAKAK